jgi:cytochrome c oxidase subunit II
MKTVVRALMGALCLMLLLSACAGGDDNAAKVEAGEEIYNTGGEVKVPCATCHTLDGSTLVGPTFQGMGERAGSRIEGVSAEDYIRQSIQHPSQFIVPGFSDAMPKTFGEKLSEEDIDNLVAFLMTQ